MIGEKGERRRGKGERRRIFNFQFFYLPACGRQAADLPKGDNFQTIFNVLIFSENDVFKKV